MQEHYTYETKTISLEFSTAGKEITIKFFKKFNGDQPTNDIKFAIIVNTQKILLKDIGEISSQFIKFGDTSAYYYITDPNNFDKYQGLDRTIQEIIEDRTIKKDSDHIESKIQELAEKNPQPTIEIANILDPILQADNICVTFGAGISAGYIPTLIEFFEILGLKKITSMDQPTLDSMKQFIITLINEDTRRTLLDNINKHWCRGVYKNNPLEENQIALTEAHTALSKIIGFLKYLGKKVFLYTDNIDGIDKKMGFKLARARLSDHEEKILYLRDDQLNLKKTIVLVVGQSFDFDGILSTLYTKCSINSYQLQAFSFNISQNPIVIYQGLDAEEIINNEEKMTNFCLDNYPPIIMNNMHCILGECKNTLSTLYKELLSKYEENLGANSSNFILLNWENILTNDADGLQLKQILQNGYGYGAGTVVPYKQQYRPKMC